MKALAAADIALSTSAAFEFGAVANACPVAGLISVVVSPEDESTSLPLTITGLLGYINPTIMFLVGFIVFHEPLTFSKIFGFIFIWTALILLGIDMYRSGRAVNQSKS